MDVYSQNKLPQMELVAWLLNVRDAKACRGDMAAIRRGLSESTCYYAYPYVLPYVPEHANASEITASLKVAAITAQYTAVPQVENTDGSRFRLGHWLRLVALRRGESIAPESQDPVVSRLAYLHTQPVGEALDTMSRLFRLAESIKGTIPATNYYDLMRQFLRWGNGISQASRHSRSTILQDFYQGLEAEKSTFETTSTSISA